jgi:hypothetical protein
MGHASAPIIEILRDAGPLGGLETAVGEFQRIIETAVIGAGTGVKHGSVKVEILALDRRV